MKVAVYIIIAIRLLILLMRLRMHVAAQWLISYVASNVYIQDKPLGQCNFGCAWLIAIAMYVASYITTDA